MTNYKRIIIKIGTSVLTSGSPQLDRPKMINIVSECAELHKQGVEIIVVSSGAVAVGKHRLGFPELPGTMASKQLFAAVGQSRLMHVWEQLFEIYGLQVGQILLTRSDIEGRSRYLYARETLNALLAQGVIPIINENDAVATEEIKLGDNDNLSAMVAMLADADLLIMLTDQPGLFTSDPTKNPDAKLIEEVNSIDEIMDVEISPSESGLGTGGMLTKLKAADYARRSGADVVIAAGAASNVISRVFQKDSVGTRFPAISTPLERRKRWILARASAGKIFIDSGAAQALVKNGRSLLSAGVLKVEGQFKRGETISILNQNNEELARAIAKYNNEDLDKIKGKQSDEITEILGYFYGAVAVHRNDLILLG
ncbi:MAG: glutamate 5-kinase [Anaerolineae bacterium]|jgi:glutamate 5-kinase|nr:glutamate 5-kinase [Anaerolineae bacterium]MBT4309848.1 glutamate 5-kinase [Anaerolineae bacterium]MBT4458907.1 glutamate 5-kinase [Anaerolineae bacterium]MBT4842385.1 glutamate 5-kinase [Anaerolineae bacterium]MBT6061461.1 glutamate 5-kinase [Anaerolineae bacterium]